MIIFLPKLHSGIQKSRQYIHSTIVPVNVNVLWRLELSQKEWEFGVCCAHCRLCQIRKNEKKKNTQNYSVCSFFPGRDGSPETMYMFESDCSIDSTCSHTHTVPMAAARSIPFMLCYISDWDIAICLIRSQIRMKKKKRIKYRMTHTGGWNMRLAWISINHITHVTFCEIRHRRLMHRKDYWLDVISNTVDHIMSSYR